MTALVKALKAKYNFIMINLDDNVQINYLLFKFLKDYSTTI